MACRELVKELAPACQSEASIKSVSAVSPRRYQSGSGGKSAEESGWRLGCDDAYIGPGRAYWA